MFGSYRNILLFCALLILVCSNLSQDVIYDEESRRRLSSSNDFVTQEYTKTYDGNVPAATCSAGYYRPPGSNNLLRVTGQRSDGCVPCPRGRYGATSGLTASTCTAPCPAGRYGDKHGATSINDCEFCPIGRYGLVSGLTTKSCTNKCPAGTYGATVGLIQASDCKLCPRGMMTGQCQWAIQPTWGLDIDHQHHETFGLKTGFVDPISQTKK